MRQAKDAPAIPAAALSTADADLLARMAARGGPVRVRLVMDAQARMDAPAWNVVAEIPGRERPEEVVVVGGHLDSWDPGQGALDDGAGLSIAIAAARIAAERPEGLRRTIRVVLWGAEEMDISGEAYAAAHAELPAPVADNKPLFQAMFTDRGGTAVAQQVSSLWGNGASEETRQRALDLFTDSRADIRKLFRSG